METGAPIKWHRPRLWILRRGQPVSVRDVAQWAAWFEESEEERTVAFDEFKCPHTGAVVEVSTIFLGIDTDHMGDYPSLWETAVFGGLFDRSVTRYVTRRLAIEGHGRQVRECTRKQRVEEPG